MYIFTKGSFFTIWSVILSENELILVCMKKSIDGLEINLKKVSLLH